MKIGVFVPGVASEHRQRALMGAGCSRVIEVGPSESSVRAVQAALDQLEPGDTLVAWRMRDLFLNVRDFVLLVDALERKRCFIQLIVEQLDTSRDRAAADLCSALIVTEQNLHRAKVRTGLEETIRAGQPIGRKRKLSQDDVTLIQTAISSGEITVREAARQFGVARATLQRHLSERRKVALGTAKG